MAYDTPFKFLNPPDINNLLSYRNRIDRSIYLDCLALMHDLVIRVSSAPHHPMFPVGSLHNTMPVTYSKLQNISVRDNVETNVNTANDLYSEAHSSSRIVTSHVIRTLVDKYIDDLLEQYRIFKNPKMP